MWSAADRDAEKRTLVSTPYLRLAHHCPVVEWIPVARLRPRPDDHIGLTTFEDIESAFERIQLGAAPGNDLSIVSKSELGTCRRRQVRRAGHR